MSAQNPQFSQFLQNPSLDKGPEAGESRIPPILRGKTYLDPLYDPAFRAFFSDEAALKDFLDALLRLPPKHLQRHGRILAAVIHIRKKVGVQVNDFGRFAAHPLSSSR